jgi:hypothetical protein
MTELKLTCYFCGNQRKIKELTRGLQICNSCIKKSLGFKKYVEDIDESRRQKLIKYFEKDVSKDLINILEKMMNEEIAKSKEYVKDLEINIEIRSIDIAEIIRDIEKTELEERLTLTF